MDIKIQAHRGILLICAVSFGLIITAGLITAASGYAVTPDNTIDTPSTTVEFEGSEYEINSISEYTPGDTITVDVALPSNDYSVADILLYNSDRNQETSKRIRGPSASETVTLDTGAAPAGTYSINLEVEGALEAIHPVVLAGFDVAVDAPGSVTVDEDIETKVTVTPTELNDDDLDGVEVVIWNDDQTERIDATADGNNEYTATISADTFETGEYNVYVAALGEETFNGEAEFLGIDDGGTLSITDDSANGDGNTNGGSGAGDSGDEDDPSTETDDGTADNDTDTNDTDNETDAETDETDGTNGTDNETDGTESSESTPSDDRSDPNGDTEANGESDDIITPTTDEDESPPVEDQPFHPGLAVIAIGLFFAARKWRARRRSGTSRENRSI